MHALCPGPLPTRFSSFEEWKSLDSKPRGGWGGAATPPLVLSGKEGARATLDRVRNPHQ